MADQDTKAPEAPPLPTLEEMQQWTWVMGRAQQMMLEHVAKAMGEARPRRGRPSRRRPSCPG